MPNSAPATPTTTLSLITSGASVMPYALVASPTCVFQIGRPFFASMATRWASTVAMNNVSPWIATPRFTWPRQQSRPGEAA